jgi:hypothetical protein
MSRALNDLDPRCRPVMIELLARAAEAGVPLFIVETLRTPEQHALNLLHNVSWIPHSKHLDGLAIDVAPYQQFILHGTAKLQWDGTDPAWQTIGIIGERLGLRWGGRWTQKDLGHLEFDTSAKKA